MKKWNTFEIIYFIAIFVLPITFAIIFESSVIECLASVLYLVWCFLVARGQAHAHFVGIFAVFLYAFVSWQVGYFGEVIIAGAISFPLIVFALVNWVCNKRVDKAKGKVVVVATLRRNEIILVILSQLLMGVGYYFLLRAFNTEFLIVSTLSIVTSVVGTYLLARRSQHFLLGFLLNDMVLVVLWSALVIGGQLVYFPLLLMPIMLLVNDTYGVWNWARLKKSQNTDKAVST